jgi:hypothetical protein
VNKAYSTKARNGTVILILVTVIFLLLSAQSHAENIVTYNFTTDTNPSSLGSMISSSVYSGTNLSDFYIGDDGFGNVLEAYPTAACTSAASALTNNCYFTITITANGGQTFSLYAISYKVAKGGDSDPRGYFIRSSVDGYATDIVSETLPSGANQTPDQRTVVLTGHDNLTSVTFRFYVFTPDDFFSVDWRDVYFIGPTQSVPTMNEWGMIIFVVLAGLGAVYYLRRKKAAKRQ